MAVWTINPPRRSPGSHPAVGLQSVTVAEHTLKVGCSLGSGKIAKCAVTLVTPGGVVVGRGVRVFRGAHQRKHGKVEVVLTARGRKLAAQPGGVRVVATATVSPVGGGTPLVARQTVHVVSPTVDVTPGELQFQSGSAVLLPGGRSYLLTLVGQLAGATRVVATGYTDAIGNAQANYRLGLARADTVCALISHRAHVACEALSYGEGHPRATNATAAGRALNRRVELRLTY
jgi:outer membrane protein OmpA-like peptidoglycan-associated protein